MRSITCHKCDAVFVPSTLTCPYCQAKLRSPRATRFTKTGVNAFVLSIIAAILAEILFIILLASIENRSINLAVSLLLAAVPVSLAVFAFRKSINGYHEVKREKLRGKGLCIAAAIVSANVIFLMCLLFLLLTLA